MDTVARRNENIVFRCHYHVVFCPKYRRKVFVNGIDARLKHLVLEIVQKWGQELIRIDVMPDHVHLLVRCDPQFGIHRLIKSIKGTSSRLLRQEYPDLKHCLPSLWTNSYDVGTTGGVTVEVVKKYVESQKGK